MNTTARTRLGRAALSFALLIHLSGCFAIAVQDDDVGRSTTYLEAEGALGPYSGSVRSGDFVFASGKIGTRGDTFDVEVLTAIDAVEAELARNGLGLEDVVQSTVYLTDMGRYSELNELYSQRFHPPYPARACVAVAALPGEARVEIQVIARR